MANETQTQSMQSVGAVRNWLFIAFGGVALFALGFGVATFAHNHFWF